MLEKEYRVGFGIFWREIGFFPMLRIVVPSVLKSSRSRYRPADASDQAEVTKANIKNHFKLFARMYLELEKRYGTEKTNEVMHKTLMGAGNAFFRGFTPIGPDGKLADFIRVYKDFEKNNITFDVVEESEKRFEIIINRCLVYEAFKELGLEIVTPWMCDIAFEYFSSYHPKMEYQKDRMIARGDESCHEIFIWRE